MENIDCVGSACVYLTVDAAKLVTQFGLARCTGVLSPVILSNVPRGLSSDVHQHHWVVSRVCLSITTSLVCSLVNTARSQRLAALKAEKGGS